jgi:hypothetical protein
MLGGVLMGAGIIFLTVVPEAGARRASNGATPVAVTPIATAPVEITPIATATEAVAIDTAALETATVPSATTEVLPSEKIPVDTVPADCCPVGPAAASCSAGRSSAFRDTLVWAADPPIVTETATVARQRASDSLAAAERPTPSTPRSPVVAGSLSLRQALDRVYPGSTANH